MKTQSHENPHWLALRNFLENDMRMSHVYQPAMIRRLLEDGGASSVEDVAKALLHHDRSQTEYYSIRTKNMVGRVLTKNGIAEVVKDGREITGYRIPGTETFSPEEARELIEICDRKIQEYIEKRGKRIWSHRSKSSGYISGTLRYEVLKRAHFRCELCGISAEEKALEVDHILPRNAGGSDDASNLQALCYSCNAMKRDRDDTDFRGMANAYDEREVNCLFCEIPTERLVAENELAYAIRDGFPVTNLHTLVIPKRHVADYFDLFQPVLNAIQSLLQDQRTAIMENDGDVTGFNMGINAGVSAGQTILHCHVHLIPRRDGDLEQPRGGVRGVIPARQSY